MGEITEIVNVAFAEVNILKSNVEQSMGALANALPKGVDPMTTGGNWTRVTSPLKLTMTWEAKYPTFSRDSVLEFGVIWTYGGSVDGRGLYIKDAQAYAKVVDVAFTHIFDASAKFADSGTPIGSQPVAMLTGTFNIVHSRNLLGIVDSQVLGFSILGDGTGLIKTL